MYVDYDEKHNGVSIWTPSQLSNIRIHLLDYLNQVIPTVTEDFKKIQGFEYCKIFLRIGMRFLNHLIEIDRTLDCTRVDLHREHESLLSNSLEIFLTLSELGPTSKSFLVNLGIFPMLIGTY
jgi:hypothetical protein